MTVAANSKLSAYNYGRPCQRLLLRIKEFREGATPVIEVCIVECIQPDAGINTLGKSYIALYK